MKAPISNSPVVLGHPLPDYEEKAMLIRENERLKKIIAQLEKRLIDYSWQVNPDRMGQ